jgi:hypothetical protein
VRGVDLGRYRLDRGQVRPAPFGGEFLVGVAEPFLFDLEREETEEMRDGLGGAVNQHHDAPLYDTRP